MSDILVKPPELRNTALTLRDSSKQIHAALQNVDHLMRELDVFRFSGQQAASIRGSYARQRDGLLHLEARVIQMADQLDHLADSFEDADKRIADSSWWSSLWRKIFNPDFRYGFAVIRHTWVLGPDWQLRWPFGKIQLPTFPLLTKPTWPDWFSRKDYIELDPNGAGGITPVAVKDEYPVIPENIQKSKDMISELDVVNNWRYHQNRQGNNETYCNIFAMDYAKKMGVPLPEYLDWNNDGKIDRYLDANRGVNWLRGTFNEGNGAVQQGPALGWQSIDMKKAAELSASGYVVIAGWENQGGIGHMAVVRPDSTADNILIAQAGARNFESGTITQGFGSGKDIEYFVYLPGKNTSL